MTVKINPNVCLMLVLLSAINGFSRVRIDDFYKAIEDGDLSLVQKQIRNGAELNYAFKPVTPLGHAIQRGSPEMVKLLLEAKANPNIAGKNNLYPLNVCTTGTMVDLLVAFGADVNINGNRRNRTPPIFHTLSSRNADVLSALVRNGADLTCRNGNGETPYQYAVNNRLFAIASLLKNAGGARSGLSADEYRALNDIDPKTRHTPLEQAINDNNVDKVRTLLLRGADVRAKGTYGETVVGQAINAGNVAVLKLLLQYDIDKNDALNIAVWAQKHEIVKYLLSIGANPNHGAGNKPPLFAAVYLHDTQMATILLENGADINGQDTSGNTALADVLLHPEYPNPNVAEYLLEKGADIHLKNKQGKSPLDQAMHCPHQYGIVIYRLMQQHNKKKKVSSHFLIGGIPLFLVYFIFIRKSWFTAGRKQG